MRPYEEEDLPSPSRGEAGREASWPLTHRQGRTIVTGQDAHEEERP